MQPNHPGAQGGAPHYFNGSVTIRILKGAE